MMMKGLVSYPDGRLQLEEVKEPELGNNPFAPDDVLIEMEYCGVCGSDVHRWKEQGKTEVKHTPHKVVVGHELSGTVKAVGPEVDNLKPGDRVVCEIVTFYCGECVNCKSGRFHICNNLPSMEGRAHFVTGGGFAKNTVWPAAHCHKLPDNVSSKEAVLMEPTAGSVHSVVNRLKVQPGESVAILGSGARGILLMQVCKALGAGPIIMSGLDRDAEFRLKTAKELGADYIINVDKEDIRKRVNEITGGSGVDVVIENTGSVDPIDESLDIVRKGGRILWAGGGIRGGIIAPVDTHKIISRELEIYGEISQIWQDWVTALHLVKTGRINLTPLVTDVFDLEDWEKAFDLAATSSECLRVAIKL